MKPLIGVWSFSTGRSCLRILVLVSVGHAASADVLTYERALEVATSEAPQVHAAAAEIDAARQSVIPAGELPDPQLTLGVENLPVEGDDRFSLNRDPMTMERIGVMQEFPSRAKRRARTARALARSAVTEAKSEVVQRSVSSAAATAWIARHTIERQLESLERLFVENKLFAEAVRAKLASGKGAATDSVMAAQERTALEERRDALQALRTQAIARLRRWVGDAADAPLAGAPPRWPLDYENLRHKVREHPELAVLDAEANVMDAQVSIAVADKRPDWALEVGYQRRAPDYSDMMMLRVSIGLPLFSDKRQDPEIAARQAQRAALEAERDSVLREHVSIMESEFAEYQRLVRDEKRLRETLSQLAEEKVALALAAWRGGGGTLSDLVAARRERIETALKTIAAEGARDQMAARLYYAYVQSLPGPLAVTEVAP
jgi:cobalt-zinc-cadmium efflux system outer membrane protein